MEEKSLFIVLLRREDGGKREGRLREDGGSRQSAKQGRESLVGGQRRKKGTTYNGNGIEKLKSRRGDKGQLRQPTK